MLVFTDVVLPGDMSGAQLAQAIRARRPAMPLLFTSGYVEDAASAAGPLVSDVELLPKPFSPQDLADKIEAAFRASSSEAS